MKSSKDALSLQQNDFKTPDNSQIGLIRVLESTVSCTLTDVIAMTQLFAREANLPPRLFDHLYRTELSCRSTAGKISTLVELYGGNDAVNELRIASYDVVQFFTVVADQINKALGHKMKGEIRFIPDELSGETVSFDARRICMILYHLISNAIQHGLTENKNVEIHASVINRKFELSVRDHGGGIPKEKTANLFNSYTQALTLDALQEGIFPPRIRGIGLPLCRKLAEDMQGELIFKSYKTGTKFTLLLPQPENRFRESAVYLPDDTLLKACMADLLLAIYEEDSMEEAPMTITYEYQDALYVNLTNRCSNACTFCVRNAHDDVNGEDNLWLEREPTLEEIKADFNRRDLTKYSSVVFCGYGEPTMRFDDMKVIAKWLKEQQPDLPIRLNTNGHANLICGRDVTPELKGCFDCISISLNAENPEKYQALCLSEFGGEKSFYGLLEFAKLAKQYVPEVIMSVVDVMPQEEIEHCQKIAEECGVKFRVRAFIQ